MSDLVKHLRAAAETLPPFESSNPDSLQLGVHLGRCLFVAGQPEAAQEIARAILAKVPRNTPATHLLIDAALRAKDFDTALDALDAGRDKFPDTLVWLRRKFTVFNRAARRVEAIETAIAILDFAPDDEDLLITLGRLYLANGQPELAETTFGQAVACNPHSVAAWIGRINAAQQHAGPEAAAEHAASAFAALPNDPGIAERSARTMIGAGRLKEAQEIVGRAVEAENGDQPGLWLVSALVHRKLGDFAAADAIHADLVARNPSHVETWSSYIQTALEQGDLDRARDICATALQHCPDAPHLLARQAELLWQTGSESEALAQLSDLHAGQPDDAAITLSLAEMYRKSGQFENADTLYARILAQDPENWSALNGRVTLAEQRGDLQTAMGLLEQGAAGTPSDAA